MPASTLAAWLGVAVACALTACVLGRPEGRTPVTWVGGVGIGAVIAATWWVSGRMGFVPEDLNTLEPVFLATNSRRMESLSMTAPVGYALDWLLFFSDESKRVTLA